jgi:fimbrial chaperone protein
MFKKSAFLFSIIVMTLTGLHSAFAGGIALGATRLIYPVTATQSSIPLINSDEHERYLIQSWVEDETGNRSNDFVITPPLFAAEGNTENTLRIIYTGKALPQDKETVYWLNVKAIPAVNPESIKDKNSLQLAILSRIKLFMRPDALKMSPQEAPAALHFHRDAGQLMVDNPTPYYQTLVNMSVGAKKQPNIMVAPRATVIVQPGPAATGTVKFQTIDDYGALSPQRTDLK